MTNEKPCNQLLTPLVESGLKRFRALLPAEVELAVALPQPPAQPRVRARGDEMQDVVVSLSTVAWQSMRGSATSIIVELDEIVLDEVVLDAGADKLQGGLPPRGYARLVVTNNVQAMDSVSHELITPSQASTHHVSAVRRSLSEVREIIHQHHGTITVSTEVGKGTSFEIYLPLVGLPEVMPAASGKAGLRHVIYVDDYEAMRDVVGETLADAGFRVSCYESAREALMAVRADPLGCDVLVTDFKLTAYSGTDLIRQLKSLRPSMPTVLISGYVDDALQAKAREAGADWVISKSSDLETLIAALRELVKP